MFWCKTEIFGAFEVSACLSNEICLRMQPFKAEITLSADNFYLLKTHLHFSKRVVRAKYVCYHIEYLLFEILDKMKIPASNSFQSNSI